MTNIVSRLSERIRRAHLQAESIDREFQVAAPALTKIAIEDVPDQNRLMEAAEKNFKQAQARMKQGQAQLSAAQAVGNQIGQQTRAAVGHLAEGLAQTEEHRLDMAQVATFGGNLEVYLSCDPSLALKFLEVVEFDVLQQALEQLGEERREAIRKLIDN